MNLEFELKRFFREDDCPRFNQDVKASICKLGTDMVYQVALYMHNFRITRLLPHVPYLIFQLCQDPYTVILRNGDAQAQRSRIKDLSKILSKVLEDAQVDVEHKKNGNIDRKIVKGVVDVLKSVNLDTTQKAAVMVAACIAEVCGILLNAAYREADRPKTLVKRHMHPRRLIRMHQIPGKSILDLDLAFAVVSVSVGCHPISPIACHSIQMAACGKCRQ